MDKEEFLRQSQEAIGKMQEYNMRSKPSANHNMPPVPSFVKVPEHSNNIPLPESKTKSEPTKNSNTSSLPFNIPFLDNFLKDADSTLILGLLLILMSENGDKLLLFALIYILI